MHTHRIETTQDRPFTGPVVFEPAKQKPAAHGNITRIDVCKCGATRRTNINGRATERGPWITANE